MILINAIINCEFEYQCNLNWDALDKTNNEFIRHCSQCKKDVKLCVDDKTIDIASIEGKCIAYPIYTKELVKRIKAYESGYGDYPFENIEIPLGLPKRK